MKSVMAEQTQLMYQAEFTMRFCTRPPLLVLLHIKRILGFKHWDKRKMIPRKPGSKPVTES
jgi:hypothetical protein